MLLQSLLVLLLLASALSAPYIRPFWFKIKISAPFPFDLPLAPWLVITNYPQFEYALRVNFISYLCLLWCLCTCASVFVYVCVCVRVRGLRRTTSNGFLSVCDGVFALHSMRKLFLIINCNSFIVGCVQLVRRVVIDAMHSRRISIRTISETEFS